MKTSRLVLAVIVLLSSTSMIQAQELFDAIKNNSLAKVTALIDNDAALVNSKDNAGNTPLHQAAINGSLEIAEYLLLKGADINATNAQQNTPLNEAIQSRKENVARLLIEKGADVNKTNVNKHSPLHRAALTDQKGIGELLLNKGALIDPIDMWGRTPFMLIARQNGDVEFGRLLLSKGADINVKDKDNLMSLNLAAWRGFVDFIDLLLDRGADYDTTRGRSRQVFSSAASGGCLRLFNVVLNNDNALLTNKNFRRNIIRTAIMGGSVEIVKVLLSKNIPLNNDANQYGWTPLHYAAASGHAAMIRFLNENQIDINQRTSSGKSLYNIAEENKKDDVLKTIRELHGDTSPKKFPQLTGPYLGQTLPAGEPELFAADIVASPIEDENHSSVTFSPDGKEIYWNKSNKIWMTKLVNDQWAEPAIVSFCLEDSLGYDNPFITPDGKKMFFTSGRPGAVGARKENIWYVDRIPSGWSEPKPVSSEVNAMQLHWSISVSHTGTLYWGGTGEDSHGRSEIY
jgi:ankyrin repeat protein